jgi:hypothetical protein
MFKNQQIDITKYSTLEKILLGIGGRHLVYMPTEFDVDVDALVKYGLIFNYKTVGYVRGEECRCHDNSETIMEAFPFICQIGHGFALSDDGLWRCYSWIVWQDIAIVETTVPRLAYYGIHIASRNTLRKYWSLPPRLQGGFRAQV